MKHRWMLRPVERPEVIARLQQELNNLPEALARALVLRGIETFDQARQFFRPSLAHLHDPFLMQDMEAAAVRVAQAIRGGERVLVYGDYDVDGTTATALMTLFLRSRGVDADYFIPDRIQDGYGLGEAGIDQAAARGARLIIALDCGITGHAQARYAKEKGLDLIICDHHTPDDTFPDAVAVLDPKRPDCAYPFKELSGCGVGFKLVQAVLTQLGAPAEEALAYLDLVALSIASDIVPVYGENRVLLREGLALLQTRPRAGIRVMAQVAGLDLGRCDTTKIVFTIGPRINAAGRMGDASRAVDLLMEENAARAAELARILEEANRRRRTIDRQTLEEARHLADQQMKGTARHSVVLHRPDWHPGVIGIVASRIVEHYYRPTIMLCTVNGMVKGSARSINGINIYNALETCSDLLTSFGGHDYAAGMSLAAENVPAFQQRFDEAVREGATPELLRPVIEIDAPLDLGECDDRFWAVLKQFAPYGPTNLSPTFHACDLELVGEPRTVGKSSEHLKFRVRQRGAGGGRCFEVIGFGMHAHLATLLICLHQRRPLEMLFSIEENTWNGTTTLQLKAQDLRLKTADPVRAGEKDRSASLA